MSRTLLVACVLAFTAACGQAEPPGAPSAPATSTPPAAGDPTPSSALPPPRVDPIATSTCGDTIPLRGVAEPGSTVFVMGGANPSGLATDTNPQTGAFCLDVALRPGDVNHLEVRAQDPDHGTSEPTLVEITHTTCAPQDQPTQPDAKPVNVALGQPVTTRDKPKKNQPGAATDGDNSTYVEVGGSDGLWSWNDWKGWVRVDLGKLYELSKIVVRFKDAKGSGDQYATKYRVLVSSMADPGDPNDDSGNWVEIGSTGDGDGGVDRWDVSQSQPIARVVALQLQQDGKPNWKESIGLPFIGHKYDENFSIAEIQVYDVPDKTPTDLPDTNSCAAGSAP